jgi:hypothetical protein
LREKLKACLINIQNLHFLNVCRTSIFSHPDYTVGFGIAPNPALKRLAGLEINLITADREFHPAPKIDHIYFLQAYYTEKKKICEAVCM